MIRIRSAHALDDYWLRLTLTDGSVVERNVRALLTGPVFEPLRRNYDTFRGVRARGGTIVWPGDVDLDPTVLIWNGPSPPDPEAKPEPSLTLVDPRSVVAA